LGSGRNSIDFAERDVSGSPRNKTAVIHKTIPQTPTQFPAEDDFKTAPKRDFDRMLMMSQRRMRYEKFKKEKRVTGRVIVKNTNMYSKWKGELRTLPNNNLFKRFLD